MLGSEWEQYEGSPKSYRDEINTIQAAGEEGMPAKAAAIAAAMKIVEIALSLISQAIVLLLAEVEALQVEALRKKF